MNKLYVLALAFAVLASPVVFGARVGTNGRMLLQTNGSEGNSTDNSTAGNYSLTVIIGLVDFFNLSSALSNTTVFAPTDDAFAPVLAALNVTSAADLTPEQQDTVKAVLALHVIPGVYTSAEVPEGETPLTNLLNTTTTVINNSTGIYVTAGSNSAKVIDADLTYPNVTDVIVHVIDAVLLPNEASGNSTA